MNNILKKTLTVGVVASSVMAVSLIDADKVNALTLNLSIQGANFVGNSGGTLSGTFSYNTITGQYSNFDIVSDSRTIGNNDGSRPFSYLSSNLTDVQHISSSGLNGFLITASDPNVLEGYPDAFRRLNLEFQNSWDNYNAVGQTNTLVLDTVFPGVKSNDTFYTGDGNAFTAALQGGTVVVDSIVDVPEPLTILGTLLAGGIGVALKKKRGASSSESC